MADLLTDDELDLGEQEQRRRAAALQAVENKKAKRGRTPANESQATDIRARLVAWKQVPESQRISLRALAVELGTSHQLLGFYLRGLDEWQRKDYERRAEDIRLRAVAEKQVHDSVGRVASKVSRTRGLSPLDRLCAATNTETAGSGF